MNADALPIADQPGGVLHPHNGRQAILAGDHRAVGHQAPHLRHQALIARTKASSWDPHWVSVTPVRSLPVQWGWKTILAPSEAAQRTVSG